MIKFKSDDPATEILDLIRVNNPLISADSRILIQSIAVNATGKNTNIVLLGDGQHGFSGKINVSYDRADIGRIFNQFGAVSHKPTLRIFGTVGSTITLVSILDQLNAKLGTKFTMSGDYQDLADQNITIPAKDGYVDITVSGKYTAGGFPTSLRVKPGSSLTFQINNSGLKVSNTAVNRSVNPLIKSNGMLNTTQFAIAPATPKKFAGFDLRNIDFTSVFNAVNNGLEFSWYPASPSETVISSLTAATITAIGAILTANGLPIPTIRPLLPGRTNYFTSRGGTYANSVGVPMYSSNTYVFDQLRSINFKPTASLPNDPLVNPFYSHVFIMPKVGYGIADTNDLITGANYYLHFNL